MPSLLSTPSFTPLLSLSYVDSCPELCIYAYLIWSQRHWALGRMRGSIKYLFKFRLSPRGEELFPRNLLTSAPTCTCVLTHIHTRAHTRVESECFRWNPGSFAQLRRVLCVRCFSPSLTTSGLRAPLTSFPAVSLSRFSSACLRACSPRAWLGLAHKSCGCPFSPLQWALCCGQGNQAAQDRWGRRTQGTVKNQGYE